MVNKLIEQDKKITYDIKLLLKHASFDQEKMHKNKEMIRTHLMFCTKCLINAKILQEFISSFAQFHNL